MTQPLDGLKVIEIGGTVSVSAAGKKFADFGADVIKIEPPQISEVRKIAPFPDDIFHIDSHKKEILELDGWGDQSYNNLIKSII